MATSNWKLTYAGAAFPAPLQNGFSPTLEPIDNANRNANGDMTIEIVAFKRTLTVNWGNLNGEEVNIITSTCRNNRVAVLNFFDISVGGYVAMKAYYSPITTPKLLKYDNELKKQRWAGLSVKFVEM